VDVVIENVEVKIDLISTTYLEAALKNQRTGRLYVMKKINGIKYA
jgi:hypothetical protein